MTNSSYRFKAVADGGREAFLDVPFITQKNFDASLDFRNKTSGGQPLTVSYDQFYTSKFVEAAKRHSGCRCCSLTVKDQP